MGKKGLKHKMIKIVIGLLIICLLGGIYLWTQNNLLSITDYEIINKKIPEDFDGFKITQISDFHNIHSEYLTNSIIEQVKVEKPDIIVLTGDIIDAHRTDMEVSYKFVSRLKEIAPVYFVPGNHEAGIFDKYITFKQGLEKRGIIVLDNKTKLLHKGDSVINLVGINDINLNSYKKREPIDRVRIELDLADYDKSNYTVLLFHRPEFLELLSDSDIDLVLAGHIHGGQIRIPFLGGVTSPARDLFPEYTAGLKEVKGMTIILSRGIGNSLFPFRVNNRPELVNIILKSDKNF